MPDGEDEAALAKEPKSAFGGQLRDNLPKTRAEAVRPREAQGDAHDEPSD